MKKPGDKLICINNKYSPTPNILLFKKYEKCIVSSIIKHNNKLICYYVYTKDLYPIAIYNNDNTFITLKEYIRIKKLERVLNVAQLIHPSETTNPLNPTK